MLISLMRFTKGLVGVPSRLPFPPQKEKTKTKTTRQKHEQQQLRTNIQLVRGLFVCVLEIYLLPTGGEDKAEEYVRVRSKGIHLISLPWILDFL